MGEAKLNFLKQTYAKKASFIEEHLKQTKFYMHEWLSILETETEVIYLIF